MTFSADCQVPQREVEEPRNRIISLRCIAFPASGNHAADEERSSIIQQRRGVQGRARFFIAPRGVKTFVTGPKSWAVRSLPSALFLPPAMSDAPIVKQGGCMILPVVGKGGTKEGKSVGGGIKNLRRSERGGVGAARGEQDPAIQEESRGVLVTGNLHIAERGKLMSNRVKNFGALQRPIARHSAGNKDFPGLQSGGSMRGAVFSSLPCSVQIWVAGS